MLKKKHDFLKKFEVPTDQLVRFKRRPWKQVVNLLIKSYDQLGNKLCLNLLSSNEEGWGRWMGQITRGKVQQRCCKNVPLAVLTLLGGGGLSGGQAQVHLFYQTRQKFRLDEVSDLF